ncbi:MAG: hypothetical protein BGP22_30330 [Variovorax sp. 67-131]|jgi:hypothetical protein|nr:MAG: hypothetical protein ABS94_10850 [Variovorax sp. SCN 67-85]ODV21629.1 MAG: hypothetical protein ABT25_22665 [Variovorax sp. SCN 67-20]OJZ14762.1 MAG: hypothetical protein BGP22_30330 [Variovorax sp. 67-131]
MHAHAPCDRIDAMSRTAVAPHRRLHFAGIAILIAGWICAVLVYIVASGNDSATAADRRVIDGQVYVVPLETSKREQQEMERLGGKTTVWMVESATWLGSLWHGKRLAFTLALLATVIGGSCVYLAGLAAEEVDG